MKKEMSGELRVALRELHGAAQRAYRVSAVDNVQEDESWLEHYRTVRCIALMAKRLGDDL